MVTSKKTSNLKYILSPGSIAVVGVSRRRDSVGQAIFSNILHSGYRGMVYPVNPNAESILGVRTFASVGEIPDKVDLAVVVVPSQVVPGVVEDCGRKRVKGMIIISAGFKEVGPRGLMLEERVKAIASKYGISLLGPNCLGVINTDPAISMNASFATTMPKEGNISFITQSGALCTAVLDYARGEGIGFSKFISMGNKADITENDLLLALADDPGTDVILMYLEDIFDEREFIRIAREITGEAPKRKPIIAVKAGRTLPGVAAAQSHTGALAGADQVYDAIFAQCGVLRVTSVEELFKCALAFATQPLPKGDRAAIVTNAGGPGTMATDACIRHGMQMATFQKNTHLRLKEGLPGNASVQNPVDLVGDAQHDRYQLALSATLADRGVDGVIVILTPQFMTDIEEIARTIYREASRYRKPVLACFMGIVDVSKGVEILRAHGIPHYTFPEATARALGSMNRYLQWVTRPRTKIRKFTVNKSVAKRIVQKAKREGRTFLGEIESMDLLDAYGLPVLELIPARDGKECLEVASKIGYPVVIKIVSPDILHKIDVKGVRLNLENDSDLIRAFERMIKDVKRLKPKAEISGVNVQRMVGDGKEVIVGMKRDPHFGPILMFGLGGIYVEALGDVTFRLAPIRELSAIRMIKSIRAHSILEGIRGERPSDTSSVAECLQRLSQLAIDIEAIQEVDLNPIIVYEKGKGCRVVHARIIVS